MYNQLISFIEQRATSQTACGGQLPYQGSLANCDLRPAGRPLGGPYDIYAA